HALHRARCARLCLPAPPRRDRRASAGPLPPPRGEPPPAPPPAAALGERLSRLYRQLAGAVAGPAGGGACPIVVSADCTTALGTVAGLQHAGREVGIVWFDAHGDVQTLETTASGYLGGLPLRLLVGYRPELLAPPP